MRNAVVIAGVQAELASNLDLELWSSWPTSSSNGNGIMTIKLLEDSGPVELLLISIVSFNKIEVEQACKFQPTGLIPPPS